MKVVDLIGRKFGSLSVIERDTTVVGRAYWICKCDCGNIVSVRGSRLSGGITKSCGCKQHVGKHGDAIQGNIKRLYRIYNNMLSRCYNPNSSEYANYGGRGISVFHEWRDDYIAFKEWAMNNGYNDSLSIDRIDVDGDYEPSNCRWATRIEQNNNKRNHVLITLGERTMNAKQWSKELGINYVTIISRYHKGLPSEQILAPVGGG